MKCLVLKCKFSVREKAVVMNASKHFMVMLLFNGSQATKTGVDGVSKDFPFCGMVDLF